ncbi:type II toxin-antitoxin system RelE family toxin [Entomobacter blattae]|uniref:ParE toxin of type II toxin-antitoxin system, parDE n=1 Tax=Entomobacter blattae TaxID=2762277 RepID=A0A7H1NP41_9PROT|nr:type II toxin-antitoxin system RelE/ParE family toxin [Entomobacter blattae]QNT77551.1 ParE toxin of type II toxin-antitoxin system, parDE [Entomobacter blattae]QNT78473.1 ParE toxin of type II toxin-antitoxin system, parDE [Entomobacter blattae]
MWEIRFSETASKEFSKLDKPVAKRLMNFLEERVVTLEDPRNLGKALRGHLGELWSYRVGDFRIIADIQDKKLCILILKTGHRR